MSKASSHDPVNHPVHYTKGGVECIDALSAATVGKTGIEAVCVANVIKYLWRYEEKNGAEDVRKAKWYLDRLLNEVTTKEAFDFAKAGIKPEPLYTTPTTAPDLREAARMALEALEHYGIDTPEIPGVVDRLRAAIDEQ